MGRQNLDLIIQDLSDFIFRSDWIILRLRYRNSGDIAMDITLRHLAEMKKRLFTHPSLQMVFLELTRKCNLNCAHCGSSCPSKPTLAVLRTDTIARTTAAIAANADPGQTMFCLTGGEPLLNPEWETIAKMISSYGFHWGMTSNGTMIDENVVERLFQAGMKTISISIDGMAVSHEHLRGVDGCYRKSLNAIRLLVNSRFFQSIQVTTVVHPTNLNELEELYNLLTRLGINSWKLTPVEPVGEARKHSEHYLTPEGHIQLLNFILEHREIAPFEITYGCSHFLPLKYDNTVRSAHFNCGAGTLIASITCEGDIIACLDVDDRARTKQGNIYQDDFWDVWQNRFKMFRRERELVQMPCCSCEYTAFCQGDSWHTWDFMNNSPGVCLFHDLNVYINNKRECAI